MTCKVKKAGAVDIAPRVINVLENFLENKIFTVTVGGNPIVVARFLDEARAVLDLLRSPVPKARKK